MSFKNQIDQNVHYALSDDNIRSVLGSDVPIVAYPDLAKIGDITTVFDSKGRCVIFFEEDEERGNVVGHWQCMILQPKVIMFFDSYGLKPDQCKKWLKQNKLVVLKEYPNYLSKLLNKAVEQGYELIFNPFKYQSFTGGVNTCGDYVCCRLLNKNLNGDQFKQYLDSVMKKQGLKSYDETVSAIMLEKYKI
jgi:hypothetical protein